MTSKRRKTDFDPCWLTPLMFAKNSNFAKMRFDKKTASREFFNSMERIGKHGLLETLIMDFRDKAFSFLESNNLPNSYEKLSTLTRAELDALPVEAKHIYEMLHSFFIVQEKIKENDAELAAWNMAKGILSAMRAEIRPLEPDFFRGRDVGAGANKGGPAKKGCSAELYECWQEDADGIWENNQRLSKSEVGKILLKKYREDPTIKAKDLRSSDWISRNIQK